AIPPRPRTSPISYRPFTRSPLASTRDVRPSSSVDVAGARCAGPAILDHGTTVDMGPDRPPAFPVFARGSAHFGVVTTVLLGAVSLLGCDTRPYGGSVMVPVNNAEPGPPGACTSLGAVDGESTGRRLPRQRAE